MDTNTLKALRVRSGKTRRDVSMETGITESTLYKLEEGRSANPSVKTAKALANCYGVSVDELLEKEGGASPRA